MEHKMEKLKRTIIKYDEPFFILLFFVIIFGINMYLETEPTDEVWNFQNIYKMYNGYKIYVDANVITTPLFHYIGVIFLKLFGANFFIFKLYGVVINTMIIFGIYKIQKSLGISKILSLFFSIVLFFAQINIYHNTVNYNNLCLLFTTYGLLITINRNKISNNKFVLFEAIIIYLVFLTKQNVVMIYFGFVAIYNLLFEKEDKWKNILKILSIDVNLILIFVVILYKNDNLNGFISYAILGIKEFSEKNFAVDGHIIKLISIFIINITFVCVINKNKLFKEEIIKNINIISILAFLQLMVAYPIFNVSHIDFALFYMYLLLVYIIYNLFYELLCDKKLIYKVTKTLIILLISIAVIRIGIYFSKVINSYEYSNLYFGSLLKDDLKEKIKEVTEYINNSDENVIVYSTEAALYMMPLNRSNGNLDEPLLGNFGKDGEDGVIKEISEMENTQIIINKDKKVYQESDKVINYIKENLNYVGNIRDLLIYQTIK